MSNKKPRDAFMMPTRVRVMGRSSSINNSFANGIVPEFRPTDEEIVEALETLGMTPDSVCCAYCGDPCTQWDHLNPLVSDTMPTGYVTEIRNLVPCCGTCNQSKGNRRWREWMYSDAAKSPKSRNVKDIDIRASKLERYEERFTPMRLDIEAIVGHDLWERHWRNRDAVLASMRESMEVSEEIATRLRKHCEETEGFGSVGSRPEAPRRMGLGRRMRTWFKTTMGSKPLAEPHEDGKVSDIVKGGLIPALVRGAATDEEIALLQSAEYSNGQFGIAFPLLRALNDAEDPSEASKDANGYGRYYVRPITISGKSYLVCSQWYDRNRQKLLRWIEGHPKP